MKIITKNLTPTIVAEGQQNLTQTLHAEFIKDGKTLTIQEVKYPRGWKAVEVYEGGECVYHDSECNGSYKTDTVELINQILSVN